MARRELEVLARKAVYAPEMYGTEEEDQVARLVVLGRALSDPIGVRMLGLMAEAMATGRSCCNLPQREVPAANDENPGICASEFEVEAQILHWLEDPEEEKAQRDRERRERRRLEEAGRS